MPNILHRLSIDAPPDRVHQLAATREGIEQWWTGHPSTLLFSHEGWRQENEFMNGCSTNWAAYLMSLKAGAEGEGFNAFPGGEISRWD